MLVVLFLAVAGAQADQYCRALALEGGGSLGAYQVGALIGLTQQMPGPDIEWNVVTGISTGSLNAVGLSLFPMGQETEMAQYLKEIWLSLNGTSSIYENWNDLGAPYGILFEHGMYSTQPLRDTLTQKITHGPMRNITVGSTDLNTGHFSTFNESLGENIAEAVMCSAAPPLYFPPQSFQGTYWADGGCILNLDVFGAVERCMDVVGDESLIIVDMIFCYGETLGPLSTNPKISEVTSRASSIKSYDSAMWFAYTAMQAYPQVDFRFTVVPSTNMPGGMVPLDFNRTVLESEITLGESDVTNIVNSQHDPREMAQEWKRSRYHKARAFKR